MLTRYQVGLQDLTASEHQIVHAYEVSGRGCRISRVWNNSSNMHTRYQDGAAGHVRSGLQDITGWELEIVHAYEVLGRGCRISRVRNTRSYMPTRYQDGATGSHGFGIPYRTCLEDLTGSEHQIEHAYEVSGRAAGSHGFGTPDRTCLEVSGRGCRISRVWNTRSYTPTRYQDGAAGSHGLGPQIEHAYELRVRTSERTGFHGLRLQSEHAYGAAIMCLSMFSPRMGARGYPGD